MSAEGADGPSSAAMYSEGGTDPTHHEDLPPIEQNPIWQQDNVTLHSVGMDIGSSGTQVVFSRLHLRRIGEDLTSRYIVVRREALYQSPIALTPYEGDATIDGGALGEIIDAAYTAARLQPDDVDTGVVILTGEALRRRNAEPIATAIASRAGELVCASAGHHMEAMLAAFGSGAARASYDNGLRLLNVDVGGGTTKLSVVERGHVVATAALHVGGRLQVVDRDGRIVRLEPAGRNHAAAAGYSWSLGDVTSPDELDHVADTMAEAIIMALVQRPLPDVVEALYLTDPIDDLGVLDGVIFSGGVAEYIYGLQTADFGDLGHRLGLALRRRIDSGALPFPLLPAGQCIRATVLGASQYSVQLSGNTCFVSDPDGLLPRRNVQVVRPQYKLDHVVDVDAVAVAVADRLRDFVVEGAQSDVALALHWSGVPAYDRLAAFARAIQRGLADRVESGSATYLMLDGDVALTLGTLLVEELGLSTPLLVIDGIDLGDFDYIDLGRVRWPSNTVPVTIKSLVFNEDARLGRTTAQRSDAAAAG